MRMRMWAVAAVVLAGAAAGPGRVAAQPAKTTEPTVEVRVRSVNDLLDRAEYIGGLVGQEEPIKQARDLVKHLSAEGKGIEGIDPKRPFGAYATVTPDVHDSPFVVMVPVADKDRLLAAMKERLNITPEKADGGLMKVFVPLVNEVYLAFANGYVYASPNAKALDAKSLIDPKAFFGKDDGSVASVVARIDRVPDQVKGLLASQLEMGLQQERKKGAAANPAEEKLKEIVFDALAGGAKTLVDDGKEVSLKLFIDAKTDELSIEAALSAKDGSTLAKNIAALAGKTSLPAGIVAAAGSPVGKAGVKLALTPDFRTRFAGLVDQGIAEVVKQAKPNERELAKRVLTTLAPTAKAGELDAAVAFTGPDAKGKYGLIGAVAVKDGAEILKLAKDLSIHIPADAAEVSFDVEKVGKFALHKVTLKKTDAGFEKAFGTNTVWVATSDDCLVASVEPDGATIRKALAAKPAPAAVFSGDLSAAKLLPVVGQNLKPDELRAMIKDAFGEGGPAGRDAVTVRISGGDRLTAQIKAKGKVLRLFTHLDQLKGK